MCVCVCEHEPTLQYCWILTCYEWRLSVFYHFSAFRSNNFPSIHQLYKQNSNEISRSISTEAISLHVSHSGVSDTLHRLPSIGLVSLVRDQGAHGGRPWLRAILSASIQEHNRPYTTLLKLRILCVFTGRNSAWYSHSLFQRGCSSIPIFFRVNLVCSLG